MRPALILMHRYVGLALASFLIIIGLTGSIIAFYEPLEQWINPDLLFVKPEGETIDPLVLRDKLEAEDPNSHVYFVHFPPEKNQSVSMYVEGAIDPQTREEKTAGYDEVFVNPYTGELIEQRQWGDFSLERKNAVTMVYFLHYSLVLPEELGEGFMGIVALIWAFDCFVGFALTLPNRANNGSQRRGIWQRWKRSWLIKTGASKTRVLYDTHRALSLWVWLVLLMFAWSGFALNLPTIYNKILSQVMHTTDNYVQPELEQPLIDPQIGWQEARMLGEKYMAEAAEKYGFSINHPHALVYRREKGFYDYRVHSSFDILKYGSTSVAIDAQTGKLLGVQIPTGVEAGTTFTSWIKALHMAMVGCMPWRIFVSFIGLVVVTLSITGIWLWLKKRKFPAEARWTSKIDA